MEVKMNFLGYEGEMYKFIHVVDNTGILWFAGKPIVEMLQNNSMNTDRAINKLDEHHKKKLDDIMNEFETCDKLPKFLQEKSIMIHIDGVKRLIDENTVAANAKKSWICEQIKMITDINSTLENIEIDATLENIEITSNKIQLKTMTFGGKVIEIVVIYDDQFNLWMYGKPIAEYLEYSNVCTTIGTIDSSFTRKYSEFNIKNNSKLISTYNLISTSIFINEAGFFTLMHKSKMPKANEFKKWVSNFFQFNITTNTIGFEKSEEIIPNQLQSQMMNFGSSLVEFTVIYDNQMDMWIYGRPVAIYLGYSKPSDALSALNSSYIKKYSEFKNTSDTKLIANELMITHHNVKSSSVFINQAGLFALIHKSTLPKAKEFQNWVHSDLLPKLSKNKTYSMDEAPIEQQQQMEVIRQVTSNKNDSQLEIELAEARQLNFVMYKDLQKCNEQLLENSREMQKYGHALKQANTQSIEIYKTVNSQTMNTNDKLVLHNDKLACVYERLLTTTKVCHQALQVLHTNAAERPKDSSCYQVLEVYEISTEDLPEDYSHLYGYTCARTQKKNAGKRFKTSNYERIYISESPNATIAWQCVKDRLDDKKTGTIEYNKNISNEEDKQSVPEAIYRGNSIYCSLNRFEMLTVLKQRSFGVDIESLNNMITVSDDTMEEDMLDITLPMIEMPPMPLAIKAINDE